MTTIEESSTGKGWKVNCERSALHNGRMTARLAKADHVTRLIMIHFFRLLTTTGFGFASLALHVVICACYLRRWDRTAALTVFPFWAWGLLGLALAAIAWLVGRRRMASVAFWLWLLTIIVGSDETLPLLRWRNEKPQLGAPTPINATTRPLRVITLNCKQGLVNPGVVNEVIPWQPDIVLFQETTAPGILHALAQRLYGLTAVQAPEHVAGNWQCSIVARGRITNPATSNLPNFMMASVEVAHGRFVEVACVHLQGAVTDVRLYSSEAWEKHATNRRSRRMEMGRLLQCQAFLSRQNPAIIGGDFNAPAGDAVFRLLDAQGFEDAFGRVGSGWPDTFPNQAPMLRIDHLWMNAKVVPLQARVVKTKASDHRMVVCDFLIY